MAAHKDLLRAHQSGPYKPLPGTIINCMMCGNPFLMRMYTGMPDLICGACFKTYAECATVICIRCKIPVAKIEPSMLDNGFYIRPRQLLHTDKCGCCDPQLEVSTVLEIDQWVKAHGGRKVIVPFATTDNREST